MEVLDQLDAIEDQKRMSKQKEIVEEEILAQTPIKKERKNLEPEEFKNFAKDMMDTLREFKKEFNNINEVLREQSNRIGELEKEEGEEEEFHNEKEFVKGTKVSFESPKKLLKSSKPSNSETEGLINALEKEGKKSRGEHEKEFLKGALKICEEDDLIDTRIYRYIKSRTEEIIRGEKIGWKKDSQITELLDSGISIEELQLRSQLGQFLKPERTRNNARGRGRGKQFRQRRSNSRGRSQSPGKKRDKKKE